MSFFSELKRRNVFRVGIAYVIVAWLVAQVLQLVLESFETPAWVMKTVLVLMAAGLPFSLFFAWAFEMTPEGLKREHEVDRSRSITPQTGRKLDFLIIGVLATAIVYLVYDKFVLDPRRDAARSQPATEPLERQQAEEGTVRSIAVLPFVNMSDDAGNEYFSDGISEEILNALASIRELKVAGRTSSFAFKGKEQDLREIGEALGVEHILEGSVRKAGTKVRITAQLIQVEDGFHLWSDTYDRELTDVFAIQDEIAGAILTQLKAALLDEELENLAATRTDSAAYDRFLLARQRIYERTGLAIEAAVEMLDTVIEMDPGYAPAWAQRGIANLLLVESQYGTLPQEQSDRLGKADLDKALALDPNLAEAWAGIGLYHTGRAAEHNQAIEALEKALELNPNLIDASNWLQIAYQNAGRNDRVLAILEDMLERDPLYRPAIGNLVQEYNRLGREEESFALLDRVRPYLGEEPHLMNSKAATLFSLGRYAEGLPLAEEAVRQQPDDGIFQVFLGLGFLNTHQFEQLVEMDVPWLKIYALDKLGRREEATMLAYENAARGFIGPLFALFNRAGRHAELVRYLESRWENLEAFQAAFPHDFNGYWLMAQVAHAYLNTGNDERFSDSMARIRAAHDQLMAEGVKDKWFHFHEALYYALAGDHDRAIAQLDYWVGQGAIGDLRLAWGNPQFVPLEGDPRYEAIQARMIENLNTQRAALGLEPATI